MTVFSFLFDVVSANLTVMFRFEGEHYYGKCIDLIETLDWHVRSADIKDVEGLYVYNEEGAK